MQEPEVVVVAPKGPVLVAAEAKGAAAGADVAAGGQGVVCCVGVRREAVVKQICVVVL